MSQQHAQRHARELVLALSSAKTQVEAFFTFDEAVGQAAHAVGLQYDDLAGCYRGAPAAADLAVFLASAPHLRIRDVRRLQAQHPPRAPRRPLRFASAAELRRSRSGAELTASVVGGELRLEGGGAEALRQALIALGFRWVPGGAAEAGSDGEQRRPEEGAAPCGGYFATEHLPRHRLRLAVAVAEDAGACFVNAEEVDGMLQEEA